MEASVATLKSMAGQLDAECVLLRERTTVEEGLIHEYLIRKRTDAQDFMEVRYS